MIGTMGRANHNQYVENYYLDYYDKNTEQWIRYNNGVSEETMSGLLKGNKNNNNYVKADY